MPAEKRVKPLESPPTVDLGIGGWDVPVHSHLACLCENAEQLEQALSEYINKPDVTVTIQQVNSKKFFLTGEVYRPGEYPLVTPTRIFDALSNAGGFRDFANKKKIILIRGAERYRFNYQDVLKGKNLGQNIFLENGDTVVVP